jgi:hypothetical protein
MLLMALRPLIRGERIAALHASSPSRRALRGKKAFGIRRISGKCSTRGLYIRARFQLAEELREAGQVEDAIVNTRRCFSRTRTTIWACAVALPARPAAWTKREAAKRHVGE